MFSGEIPESDVLQSTATASAVVVSAKSRFCGLLKRKKEKKKPVCFSPPQNDLIYQMVGFCEEMKAAGVVGETEIARACLPVQKVCTQSISFHLLMEGCSSVQL